MKKKKTINKEEEAQSAENNASHTSFPFTGTYTKYMNSNLHMGFLPNTTNQHGCQ